MAQFRHFQIFRNETIYNSFQEAKTALDNLVSVGNNIILKDGEMVLVSYTEENEIHSIIGVVRVITVNNSEVRTIDYFYCSHKNEDAVIDTIQNKGLPGTLHIGPYEYDGRKDVTVNVYDGSYTVEDNNLE